MKKELKGHSYSILATIDNDGLTLLVVQQCKNFFPDKQDVLIENINSAITVTIDRLYQCFSKISAPYFNLDNKPFFNHLHGDHYSMFLYILSNTLYKRFELEMPASKVFLLNKALFGIDAFYAIELPQVFIFVHPIGTILGRAKYQDYLVVYQGVTVGATTQLQYPQFGEKTILYSNSSIIGNCEIGANVVFGANATIINHNIDDFKTVVGNYPNNKLLETNSTLFKTYFKL